ncbi:Cilia- and flagella-associated protein 91 [Geodia barretti]|uniref:Cilia- and flagella-associated protein 91 n=1 Tax=Geodia barretti TaxID=519541 RepID=A0AA35S7F8_GEOBA|nr:Cilia- and flagella-associated protein 91 [Geodia barretti]
MATYTQTVHKPFVRPSRTYDYLYDPNFTVSSEQDHAKEAFKAHTSIDRIHCVPQFRTMFSVLRHYPRQRVTLDSTDPVPRHVPRVWRGYPERHRQTLLQFKKFNYAPDLPVPEKTYENPEAGGRNRYHYFRRPIIPFLPQMPPSVLLAPTRVNPAAPPGTGYGARGGTVSGGGVKSVGVQTDYRDSETQTEPYSPEYLVRPGSQPELLTLASLCYGKGLPAGLAEVEMIERAREKRRWEEGLPPIDDPNQLERRRAMMEEQERREWEHRENEIRLLQEERMALVEETMRQREAEQQELNERRLEHLWSKHRSEGERKLRRLRANHVKSLRQLSGKVAKVTSRSRGRNIIQSYTNFDSEASAIVFPTHTHTYILYTFYMTVYAPMTRTGVFLDAGSEKNTVHSMLTNTLEGLLDLEASLPAFITQPRVCAPERERKVCGLAARQKVKLGRILDQVHCDIIAERQAGQQTPRPLRLLQKVEKPVPRPPTPTCLAPPPGVEEREQAVVLLQRVIRGRSRQAKLYAAKEQRADLIRELRTTHALQSPEQAQKRQEKKDILSKQTHKLVEEHREAVVSDAVEEGAALCVGDQLDFLQKELERLQEERRVHAFLLLAERQRRMREAEESGRRQREERLRRIHDELFKQTVRVHSGTVDSFLEDVILSSVERTADQEAREEVRRQADTINTIAHQFVHTEVTGKELAAELVYSFLLPEVERQTTREKVQRDQRRHLLAAHRIIHSTVCTDIAAQSTTSGPPPPPPPSEGATNAPLGTTARPPATNDGMVSTADSTSQKLEHATTTIPLTTNGLTTTDFETTTEPKTTDKETTTSDRDTTTDADTTGVPLATGGDTTTTPQTTDKETTDTTAVPLATGGDTTDEETIDATTGAQTNTTPQTTDKDTTTTPPGDQ